jgi:hypothetical protein
MVLGWSPFNIVSDSHPLHSKWLLLLNIEKLQLKFELILTNTKASMDNLKKVLFLVTAAILNGGRGCRTQF